MKKNTIAIVLIILFVIGAAFIVQRKLRVRTHAQTTGSESDNSGLITEESKNNRERFVPITVNENISKDQNAGSENLVDPEFQQLIDLTVKQTNSEIEEELLRLHSASYKQRWYRKTYLATKERLKQTDKPQTLHGTIGSRQLFKNINELPAVHAKTRGKGYVSSSMIIDGAYSLGQLEPATYEILLGETSKTPAIKVHSVEIKENQPSLTINFELGTASALVHIYDEKGNPLDSNDVHLLIGGTADDIHMYKRVTGVKEGLWQVDHLYVGQYYARAIWNDKSVGGLFDLVEGQNEIELSLEKKNAEIASRSHSER
jgi:hypothetical protein